MRTKYIIFAALALIGVVFGGWNWVNYFKQQSAGTQPQVQAVRPPPNPEIAAIEQQMQVAASADSNADESLRETAGPKMDLPDTIGRNPFLTPEEIGKIARGELVVEQPTLADLSPPPVLKLSALLKDNISGDYVALIGGKAYREGELIGQELLVEITESTVVLEQGSRRRTLTIRNREGDSGVSIRMRKN
ncbi:MAG: hypothetical protein FVQ81_01815 [Candidatus Glassbacteria bacterium]|nr:hypothetical protein [Candidatus Glassbacteria bacterium]